MTCRAPGCDREATARGLCITHYKRDRRGAPLATPEVGTPSGHGRYGVLDGDDERIMCHECGQYYRSLGAHVSRAHDMTAAEYKDDHGLPRGTPLVAPALSREQSENARARVGTEVWERMVARRDPAAASRARTPEDLRSRGPVARQRAAKAVENLAGIQARPKQPQYCSVCGGLVTGGARGRRTCSPLCARIRQYEARPNPRPPLWSAALARGDDIHDVARRDGVTVQQVRQGVERLEAHRERRAWLAEHGPGPWPPQK